MRRRGRERRWRVLAIVALVAVGGVTGSILGAGALEPGAGPTTAESPSEPSMAVNDSPFLSLQDQPDADATVTRIRLHENGSATWTIAVRTRLSSAEEAEDYEAFQERFRSNRSRYLADFEERMTGVVANANGSLERPMAAEDFAASTRIEDAPQRWGVVAYSFRWEGFAATDRGTLTVGDVFGGEFFIEENSVLEVVLPEDHDVETVAPSPDRRSSGSLEWEGPTTFGDGQPRVVATADSGDGGVPALGIVAGIGLLLLLVAGLAVAWRRGAFGRVTRSSDAPDETATEAATAPAEPRIEDSGPVTDEDRVRSVLEARGGRCKQSRIVEELDWSKSKTSRVLSRMAEDGRIEKLRIGRENVIELPEEE